jgi:hypothetical protein
MLVSYDSSSDREYDRGYSEQKGDDRNQSKGPKLAAQRRNRIGHSRHLLGHAGDELGLFAFICLELGDPLIKRLCAGRLCRFSLLQELFR